MSSKLFEDEDSESDVEINANSNFAKSYNVWRQKEELNRLKSKYNHEENSDSSTSSDDDDMQELDGTFEKEFLKTLSYLKNKDPRIYDKGYQFFNDPTGSDDELKPTTSKKEKNQPMYIKDYERNLILEKGGQLSDDEEEISPNRFKTYVEEQDGLKQEFKKALQNDTQEEEAEEEATWGGLFKTRQKTKKETVKEEEDYLEWLAGQKEHLANEDVENDLKPLKEFWTDPKLDVNEKFLRDYVLKKRFLDMDNDDYIPTYDEVIHDSDENLSEDEKAIDNQEEFEHKYNFRFEEPDKEFIKRYPRTVENSLRQKDDKRKVKRLERKERKTLEKKQKMEEIENLKALKMAEIEEKIKKIKEITGNTEMDFKVNDFEDDFDPEEHDKRMQNLFNNEFYNVPEGEQKPEFPDLDQELELENWDYWHGEEEEEEQKTDKSIKKEDQPHCEDENFNMDCDYDPNTSVQQELLDGINKKKKKRRRKSKFAKVLSVPKPVFDPNDKTYEQYLEEYYKLDCEDVIGDVPCRFKYRSVVPNNFGLTIEEILTAKDKELNRWCSLKKAIQYRPDHVEKYDVIAFDKKGKNVNLKKKYLPSLFSVEETSNIAHNTPPEEQDDVIPDLTVATTSAATVQQPKKEEAHKKEGKRKRKLKKVSEDIGISNARLTAYGIKPKRFKNKLKYADTK